jgi:hypothetical protein
MTNLSWREENTTISPFAFGQIMQVEPNPSSLLYASTELDKSLPQIPPQKLTGIFAIMGLFP